MHSVDLIIKELNYISNTIEGVEIRYEFDKHNLIHLVEIKPLDLFENNTSYLDKEIELEDRFFELFPKENLVFISEGSLSKIMNPDLVLPLKIKYETQINTPLKFNGLFGIFDLDSKIEENNNYALAA
jgi:hypothetical protein